MRKELIIKDIIKEKKVPLIIKKHSNYTEDDILEDKNMNTTFSNSISELVYCDNDICYYDCRNGNYLYIDTEEAFYQIMKNGFIHDNNGVISVEEFSTNFLYIDETNEVLDEIIEKYFNYSSINKNCYVSDEFKDKIQQVYNKSGGKDINLIFVKECVDYSTLKDNLTDIDLIDIEYILSDFNYYQNKYDDGEMNITDEYVNKYGNSNVINWYEGLKTTEDFITEFKIERKNYNKENSREIDSII